MTDNKSTDAPERTSRRRFAKRMAVALVAAPLVSSTIEAQTPSTTKQTPAPPSPQPSPTPQKPTPLGEAYGEVARIRFGEKLTPEELARLKRGMEGNVSTAERLRAVKLKNSDEPDFVFSA